jgi:hypothetical protein
MGLGFCLLVDDFRILDLHVLYNYLNRETMQAKSLAVRKEI